MRGRGPSGQLPFQGTAPDTRSARCGDVVSQPGRRPLTGGTDPMTMAQDCGRPALENHIGALVVVTGREVRVPPGVPATLL